MEPLNKYLGILSETGDFSPDALKNNVLHCKRLANYLEESLGIVWKMILISGQTPEVFKPRLSSKKNLLKTL